VSNTSNRGLFVWHDLVTTDPATAARFYAKVVSWEMKAWGHKAPYTLCLTAAGPVAGISALPEDARAIGASPYWLGYIATPDLDATVAQATGLGARVLQGATMIEGTGTYAVLADPQGATFGVYTPARPAPPPPGGNGEFVWHELTTSDTDAALGFYRALFGWSEMHRMDMGAMGPYVIFGSDGVQRGGIYRRQEGNGSGPYWMAYAHVPNADAATTVAQQAGARVLHGPADIPGGGRITMLLDPQGAAIAVHSAKMEAKPAAAAKPAAKQAPAPMKKATPKKKAAPKAKPAPKRKAATKRKVATKRKAAAKRKVARVRRKAAARKAVKRAAPKRGKPARKAVRKPVRKVARKATRRKSARRRR
jgi:uncharacterized protein